jgi:hypothetical protein
MSRPRAQSTVPPYKRLPWPFEADLNPRGNGYIAVDYPSGHSISLNTFSATLEVIAAVMADFAAETYGQFGGAAGLPADEQARAEKRAAKKGGKS